MFNLTDRDADAGIRISLPEKGFATQTVQPYPEAAAASQLARAITMKAPDSHFFESRMISPTGRVRQVFLGFKALRENPELWDLDVFPLTLDGRGDVYFSVASRIEPAGRSDSVGLGLTVWADMDDQDAQHVFPIPPSAVVETSPPHRKFHAYWFLDQPTSDMDLLVRINQAIPNADLNAIDKARVLRAPGFMNLKYDSRPTATLVRLDADRRYSLDSLRQAFPPTAAEPSRVSRSHRGIAPDWLSLVYDALLDFLERGGFHPQSRGAEGAVMALCPLHADTNKSLSLHPIHGYYCFGCRSGGRLSRLANLLGVRV